MGTTQKNIIMRTIGLLFKAATVAKAGSFIPQPSESFNGRYKGSKINNRQPAKVRFSLVQTLDDYLAAFRNCSTGELVTRPYKKL